MLRSAFLALIFIVSLSSSSSSSMLRKSISRRQNDPQYCHAIEGFECKCSYYRVTCTTDRELSSPISILPNEKQKYQSVELVITAPRDVNVNDQTFAPVKELYKPDADNFEFRVKFEKFTALHLSSPAIFNQVYPDNAPVNARKQLALEIYNPDVPPHDNPSLFKNLNADRVELYALYPFKGSFQQLFDGANIKTLRLSGGEIRSDASQSFTGNIGRLELAKQADTLSVQNFPVYPAHELTIDAFYVDNFNAEHPPNYNNLGELRVQSNNPIPANAFRNFPNVHTLQVSTEQAIDPQAFNGLNSLEKLIIKDAKFPIENLNNLPNLKEFETNIDKLDEKTQCQLIEKLASGKLAVQSIPNGRECTCVSAYLDSAIGRVPCDATDCDRSTCAAIKNNYNAETRTFNAPPAILRADGSNALRPRDPRVYTSPSQIAPQDQQKLVNGIPQQPTQVEYQPSAGDGQGQVQPNPPYVPSDTPSYPYGNDYYVKYNENPYRDDDTRNNENPGRNDADQYTENPYRNGDDRYNENPVQNDGDQYNVNPIPNNADQYNENPVQNDGDQYKENPIPNDADQYTQTPILNNDGQYTENPYRDEDDQQNENSQHKDHDQFNENPNRNGDPQYTENLNQNNDDQHTEYPIQTDPVQYTESPNQNDGPSFSENNQDEQNNPIDTNNEENSVNDDNNALLTTTATESDWNNERVETTTPYSSVDGPQEGQVQEGYEGTPTNEGGDNQPGSEGTDNRQEGNENQPDGNVNQPDGGENQNSSDYPYTDSGSVNGTDTAAPSKKGMSWLPIIIIAAAIVALLLVGLLVLFLRKKRGNNPNNKDYTRTATNEPAGRS